MPLITRVQQPDSATFVTQPTIGTSVSRDTWIHTIICGASCPHARIYHAAKTFCARKRSWKAAKEIATYTILKSSAASREATTDASTPTCHLRICANYALGYQKRNWALSWQSNATMADFFKALERGLYDNDSTNIRTAWRTSSCIHSRLRGRLVSCSGLEICSMHLKLAQDKFPRWSLVYSVMREWEQWDNWVPQHAGHLRSSCKTFLLHPDVLLVSELVILQEPLLLFLWMILV